MDPENYAPDWDLDMQYEDRFACLDDYSDTTDVCPLDPADEENYDADADPATGTEYGDPT